MNNLYLISNGSGKPIKTKYVWVFFLQMRRHMSIKSAILAWIFTFYVTVRSFITFFAFFRIPSFKMFINFKQREKYIFYTLSMFLWGFFFIILFKQRLIFL